MSSDCTKQRGCPCEWHERHRRNARAYYRKNRKRLRAEAKERSLARYHADGGADRAREYAAANREKIRERDRRYYARNKALKNQRYLASLLRNRILQALGHSYRAGSAVRDLGCSLEQFREHLQALFEPGMTWENHGKAGWHIDHKIPLDAFDLSDPVQFSRACHFTNMQPMWARPNIIKKNKVFECQRP